MQAPHVTELIELAAASLGSEYKLAKALGIPQSHISEWKAGKRPCSPEDQALMAYQAGRDPEEALVRAVLVKHADTAKGERLLSALGKGLRATGAAATLLIFGSAGFLAPTEARARTPSAAPGSLIATMYRKAKSFTLRPVSV